MFEHEKRAWRMVEQRLEERGLMATQEAKVEIVGLALMREQFWYCLDVTVDWAIDVCTSSASSTADDVTPKSESSSAPPPWRRSP